MGSRFLEAFENSLYTVAQSEVKRVTFQYEFTNILEGISEAIKDR